MTTEEIVKAAYDAGFSSSEIHQRLAEFKRLIDAAAAAEREACANECEDLASEVFPHAQAPYKKSAKSIRARWQA